MAKSIKFTASGSSSALGNFLPGDIARNIPDALADHLVKEAMCAEYVGVVTSAPVVPPPADPRQRQKKSAAKSKDAAA